MVWSGRPAAGRIRLLIKWDPPSHARGRREEASDESHDWVPMPSSSLVETYQGQSLLGAPKAEGRPDNGRFWKDKSLEV